MTLYARQQKRHRCKEQTFGLCGRRQGWDDLREQHWNMYIITCEIDHKSRFDARDRVLRAGALGWPRGMGWGGRWERGSGWGTHVHLWLIHVNVQQKPLRYCKVISLQLIKINGNKKEIEKKRTNTRSVFSIIKTYLTVKKWICIYSIITITTLWEKIRPYEYQKKSKENVSN